MAASRKASLALCMVALIAQGVPTVTSVKVSPHRIDRGIHKGNTSRTSANAQAVSNTAASSDFGPYDLVNENYQTLALTSLTSQAQSDIQLGCGAGAAFLDTDISFRIQRDDSSHSSSVTYMRRSNGQVETFTFIGGYADHTRLEYNRGILQCICSGVSANACRCQSLGVESSTEVLLLSIDFNLRSGSVWSGQWFRN
ncbi:unnamed protein product [Prorocentrum cordatum]|uniref:Uncharacterized protein n=1 Tax=Prorocentrum cordatum TaxID=2364126 RepID=A0ABN9STD0_9DINO|nr:unnamed protein product [Polarella glacialis]